MTESDLKCYKIRDSGSLLWSTGGAEPKFNRVGKTWSRIGHVKTHLAQYLAHKEWRNRIAYDRRQASVSIPETWEVVEFVVSKTEGSSRAAREVYVK